MTVRYPQAAKAKPRQRQQQPYVLPEIPEKDPDDRTSSKHLSLTGNQHHLMQYLGSRETTIVSGERYITRAPGSDMRYPDLMVVFDGDPDAYESSNGYIVSQQGKPPDFVLEIASRATAALDTTAKRDWYAALGVPEYWRFDETGEFHGVRLAGDRLVNGEYQPITIETPAEGVLQGYSAVLNLYLRWEGGGLLWHDPATGRHIPTFEQEREARLQAEQTRLQEQQARQQAEDARLQEREARIQAEDSRLQEREARIQAEQTRLQEQQARIAAEARVRELEAELERRQRP